MLLKSIYSTKKLVIIIILNLLIIISLFILFDSKTSEIWKAVDTFSNTDSSYVAFDKRKFNKNCYKNYKDKVSIALDDSDSSIVFRSILYEFINDVEYDNKSLLNEKNIYKGEYKILENKEIAIPLYLHNKYSLDINDLVYIDNSSYEIKYIFYDLYSISDIDLNGNDYAVFVGHNEQLNSNGYLYAIFDNVAENYNSIYLFSKFKNEIAINLLMIFLIELTLLAIEFILTSKLFYKQEIKNLLMINSSGSKKRYYKNLFLVDIYIYIFPLLIVSIYPIITKNFINLLAIDFSCVFIFLIKIILLKIKTR